MPSVSALKGRVRGHALGAALASTVEETLARRQVPAVPSDALVDLDQADDVLLVTSRRGATGFHAETFSHEQAYALELAARGRRFAMTDQAHLVIGKRVLWAHPPDLVTPRLWDHARQVREFAAGLEAQGNTLVPSGAEVAFWENKAHMHRRLDEVGAPTPRSFVATAEDRTLPFDDEGPLLVKQEHSAGSDGIDFLPDRAAAAAFVDGYAFRPGEGLIVQEIVRGATRDLRLTMVGATPILSATYWRQKSEAALKRTEWVTTATTFGSLVIHEAPPAAAVEVCARVMEQLGVTTAGFDLMWVDDDVSGQPLILELSPFYQPNPPKPERYAAEPYSTFKKRRFRADGYYRRQHLAHRDIAAASFDQGRF